jgi:hypothetical protein
MDEEVDPRAGSSFCGTCRKRRGPAHSGRFCSCCHAAELQETELCGSPQSESLAWSEDENLLSDDYLESLGDDV